MIEWWSDQHWGLRYGIALAMLGAALVLLLLWGRIYFWLWGLGIVMLLFAGRSESEKKGYRF